MTLGTNLASPRDTNLAGASGALPMAFMMLWYEDFDAWLEKQLKRKRHEIADKIEATARSLGLENFKSSVRW